MGGQGGAYRVSPSGGIVQLQEADKQALSRQVDEARREMAQKALNARLKQIDMSEYEARAYERYVNAVKREIAQLRVIFESVEAKEKELATKQRLHTERVWQKHKSSGDLDDNALVDGVAGDRNIYKYRGEEKPEPGAIQEKPKRLRFVIDLSGSMYRFNGADSRLDRTLECIVMITEALKDFEHKYNYSIVGHSGESPETLFVDWNAPPKDEKERYKLIRKMGAHAEYCANGDTTVEAVEKAVERVLEAEGDDYFVFALSDANLSRYGIKPESLNAAMRKDARVSTYVIFIASLGDSAEQYRQSLPPNRAHVCLDTSKLPTIFKQIFTTHMLQQL